MTVYTVQDAIAAIQDEVSAITTLRLKPDYAPEIISVFPAIITYARSGKAITGEFGIAEYRHNIVSEVHIPRKDLARDLTTLMPFIEDVIEELTLGDTALGAIIEEFDQITYEVGPSKYADTDTLMIRFVITNILMFPYGKK